jgi:hypothetical protein
VLKILSYLLAVVPFLIFVKAVFFRRSPVLKKAAEDFNRNVGYLSQAIVIGLGLAFAFFIVHKIFNQ